LTLTTSFLVYIQGHQQYPQYHQHIDGSAKTSSANVEHVWAIIKNGKKSCRQDKSKLSKHS
jgi:hypothetical protein